MPASKPAAIVKPNSSAWVVKLSWKLPLQRSGSFTKRQRKPVVMALSARCVPVPS